LIHDGSGTLVPIGRRNRRPDEVPACFKTGTSPDLLVLLFTSLLTIPLARQSCLDATLFTGLQIVGVTLHFLDDVLLLYLSLEAAQRILERLAFLNTNLCQRNTTSKRATGQYTNDTGRIPSFVRRND
jgi:hypothetical protein